LSFLDTPDYPQSAPRGAERKREREREKEERGKTIPLNRPEEKEWGKVSRSRHMRGDKTEEKRRQNLEEAERDATGKFGCEMKGGGGREGGKRELCREGRVNGERSISPWMMRGRLTLPGQI